MNFLAFKSAIHDIFTKIMVDMRKIDDIINVHLKGQNLSIILKPLL